jgi:hypothetical protein
LARHVCPSIFAEFAKIIDDHVLKLLLKALGQINGSDHEEMVRERKWELRRCSGPTRRRMLRRFCTATNPCRGRHAVKRRCNVQHPLDVGLNNNTNTPENSG